MAVLARQPNRPSLRSRQCREALVDHVAEYYELVAEQRHRGGHVDPASYQISRISSQQRESPKIDIVALLSSSSLQQESVLERYAQVQRTANSARALGPEATEGFLSQLERSGNPILSLYAVTARALPDNKY